MLIWKSYNLNRFAKPTRCHPFNSFLQQPGVITCMVVILFATRGSIMIPLKNDHDEEFKSQVFYWSCYVYCCERYDDQREESFKRWWKRRIHGIFFVIEPIAAPSACSFLPGAVNLAKPSLVKYLFSALCNESKKSLLKWYSVPARLLSFDMVRFSWQEQWHVRSHAFAHAAFGLFHFRWKV